MKAKASRNDGPGVSLFPFLAVLICTMGALIVLLVLVVQQARLDAQHLSEQRHEEKQADHQQQQQRLRHLREEHLWRKEVLEEQRVEMTEQIGRTRLELSYLEDYIRSMEEQWEQLQRKAAELQRLSEAQSGGEQAAQHRLEQLQAQIDRARDELQRAKEEAAEHPRSFAIVPYQGPQGTHRRPIYIECTHDAVILQPEGIRLAPDDFQGPLGPGNPLDAALRAIREYWSRHGVIERDGEPYPLLLVRPEGVVAYGRAREAMKAWDDEFGYELVDSGAKLHFPEPDPQLRDQIQRAITDARARQQALMMAMPRQYGRGRGGMVATNRGGFAPLSGSPESRSRGTSGSSSRSSSQNRASPGTPATGSATSDFNVPDFDAFGGYGQAGSTGGSDAPGRPFDAHGGDPGGGNDSPQTVATGSGAGGQAGSGSPSSAGSESQAAGGADGDPDEQPDGMQQMTFELNRMADRRGNDWALPDASHHAVAVKRPLRVACMPDRLVLLPQVGEHWRPITVMLEGPMHHDIDQFVDHVRDRIDSWGIALPGGYWKPVLVVEVAPGAERRLEEMRSLLENSGLEIRRKSE